MSHALFESDTFVILDFETTGTSSKDRVIEVAALRYRDGRLDETFTTLIDPGVEPSEQIVRLTGIDGYMLRGAPRPEHVFPRLVRFIDESPVVAHNAPFDQRFLEAEVRRTGVRWPGRPFHCTLKWSRLAWPGLRSYKLGDLASELKLPIEGNLHRAEADARLTGHLWLRIVEKLAPHRTPLQAETAGNSAQESAPAGNGGQESTPEGRRPQSTIEGTADVSQEVEESPAGETKQRLLVPLETAEFGGELPVQIHAKRLVVKVPAGVQEGQVIRLRGVTRDGSDALLEIAFEPHHLFRLQGRDLFLTLRVPPWSAALGATLPVPTLWGEVAMKVPPNSNTGMRLRLRGRGRAGEPRGDQIVILEVSAPRAETDAQKAAYAELARSFGTADSNARPLKP